jgi:hypothetical protein
MVVLHQDCAISGTGVLKFYTLNGNVAKEVEFSTNQVAHSINIADLPANIYFYKCTIPSCGVFTGKLIKQ